MKKALASCGLACIFTGMLLLTPGCGSGPAAPVRTMEGRPAIYPDYEGVTIPPDIAPLDFSLEGSEGSGGASLEITGSEGGFTVRAKRSGLFSIPRRKWRRMLASSQGDSLRLTVRISTPEGWKSYEPFFMHVAAEPCESHLAYRLIAPGYGLWNRMGIYQRNLRNYSQTPVYENFLTGNNCVNCHSFPSRNPSRMVFHMRAQYGGTVFIDGKRIEKLDTKTDSTISALVYPFWHPSGKFIAFSVNKTSQAFHSNDPNRLEVFDSESDVVVYDVTRKEVFSSPLLRRKEAFETFPTFSPDGKSLFFCSAKAVEKMPEGYRQAHYSLCRIAFDPETKNFSGKVDTLFAAGDSLSASFPRVSPDGRYLVFTRHAYGNFSIWHRDSDLWCIRLDDGQMWPLEAANSDDVDSYHSWSGNSRWLVFSSRRDDGLYTRPYIACIRPDGRACKPFMLPQKDPVRYYGSLFCSFNIPEFISGPVKVNRHRIAGKMKKDKGTPLTFRTSPPG